MYKELVVAVDGVVNVTLLVPVLLKLTGVDVAKADGLNDPSA
jgi:hypothetical protein